MSAGILEPIPGGGGNQGTTMYLSLLENVSQPVVEGPHCPSEGSQGPLRAGVQQSSCGCSRSLLFPLPTKQLHLYLITCWGARLKESFENNVQNCLPGTGNVVSREKLTAYGPELIYGGISCWALSGLSLGPPHHLLLSDHLPLRGTHRRCVPSGLGR